ncbi:MAG: serine hydrolase, partial [Erysipelotrichaceae bacterium]|nr:serine hydrolase [Erysipelotrichaceae bacterium]
MSRVKKLIAAGMAAGILASMALPVLAEDTYPSGMGVDEFRYRLEDNVDDLQDDGKMAAMGMAVFTADEVLYTNVFGYTDIENEIEADELTVFDWGPTAQMLVWTSAMQLKEQGLLDL